MRVLFAAALGVFLGAGLMGCSGAGDSPPSPPQAEENVTAKLPLTGPNQVVFSVPTMTWGVTWGGRVRAALRALPWVEQSSIYVDVKVRQIRFTVMAKERFNAEEIKDTLKQKNFPNVKLLAGPSSGPKVKGS